MGGSVDGADGADDGSDSCALDVPDVAIPASPSELTASGQADFRRTAPPVPGTPTHRLGDLARHLTPHTANGAETGPGTVGARTPPSPVTADIPFAAVTTRTTTRTTTRILNLVGARTLRGGDRLPVTRSFNGTEVATETLRTPFDEVVPRATSEPPCPGAAGRSRSPRPRSRRRAPRPA